MVKMKSDYIQTVLLNIDLISLPSIECNQYVFYEAKEYILSSKSLLE